MQSHARSSGGCFACHQARWARWRQRLASCRSRAGEWTARERGTLAGGRPVTTVSQYRVSARKRRMWRRQAATFRALIRVLPARGLVVTTVVLEPVVVVLPVEPGLPSLPFDPVAAAAAVAMPAN